MEAQVKKSVLGHFHFDFLKYLSKTYYLRQQKYQTVSSNLPTISPISFWYFQSLHVSHSSFIANKYVVRLKTKKKKKPFLNPSYHTLVGMRSITNITSLFIIIITVKNVHCLSTKLIYLYLTGMRICAND